MSKKAGLEPRPGESKPGTNTFFCGRNNTVDTIIPPLVFAAINALAGLLPATISALGLAGLLTMLRLFKKQSWMYALSGLGVTSLAAATTWITQNATSFFLPALLTSGF